jgi:hypothetical protein
MFSAGPRLGTLIMIGEHVLEKLEGIYQDVQTANESTTQKAKESAKKYVEELAEKSTAKKQAAQPTEDNSGNAPANKK